MKYWPIENKRRVKELVQFCFFFFFFPGKEGITVNKDKITMV